MPKWIFQKISGDQQGERLDQQFNVLTLNFEIPQVAGPIFDF